MLRDLCVALAVVVVTAPAWAADPARPGAPMHHPARAAEDADDTGRNVRDRDSHALTPIDQSETAADRTITQQIRKAVVSNDHLSINAHNVKIITQDGVVTLRGPVKTQQEKAQIEAAAQKVAGVTKVDSQLEV